MKRRNRWKQSIGCLLFVSLCACTDTKEVVLPQDDSILGLMGVRGRYAKMERPYQLACITQFSEHAQDVRVMWSDGVTGEALPEDERREEASYKTFVWNEQGLKTVECRIGYTYGDEYKELVQRDTIEVVAPIYGKCFFADSLERVKVLCPGMELHEESREEIYIDRVSATEYALLSFNEDLLTTVEVVRETDETLDNPYRHFMEWVEQESDGYAKVGTFDCGINYENISEEDKKFIWEVWDGKELTEVDIERLNRLLEEGSIYFKRTLTHKQRVFSYGAEYSFGKSGDTYSWSRYYVELML